MRIGRESALKMPSARWRQVSSVLIAIAGVLAVAACGEPEITIVDRVRAQATRFPRMSEADVYKFVHQAAFGNGHLMSDEAAARQYLISEIGSVTADEKEPLVDYISPDGSVVRVNLRPFKARGLDVTKLGDVMIESSKKFTPNPEVLTGWWTEIVDAASRRQLPFDAALLRTFGAARQAEGYPAVHHSEQYGERYRPAYRVVLRDLYFATFR
jgi:hypothetical protein